jgi:hypothetical protein
MFLKDGGRRFRMSLVDFATRSGNSRNKSIHVGHDVLSVNLYISGIAFIVAFTLGDSAFLWPYDDDCNFVNMLPRRPRMVSVHNYR